VGTKGNKNVRYDDQTNLTTTETTTPAAGGGARVDDVERGLILVVEVGECAGDSGKRGGCDVKKGGDGRGRMEIRNT
jgi:hypothetical protein